MHPNNSDVWVTNSEAEEVLINVLVPNGLIIPLKVSRDASLLDIKEVSFTQTFLEVML